MVQYFLNKPIRASQKDKQTKRVTIVVVVSKSKLLLGHAKLSCRKLMEG